MIILILIFWIAIFQLFCMIKILFIFYYFHHLIFNLMKIKFHGFSRLSISGLITFYVFIGLFQSYNLDRRFCNIFHVGLILTSFVTHLPWTIFYVIFLTPFQYLNIIFSTKKKYRWASRWSANTEVSIQQMRTKTNEN